MKIDIINDSNNTLPQYETAGAAGFDFKADISTILNYKKFCFGTDIITHDNIVESIIIHPGGRCLISTGIKMAIPKNYVLLLYSRSGHGVKNGLSMSNSVGVIDSDYRDYIGIPLINNGTDDVIIHQGDRMAQGIIMPYPKIEFNVVKTLDSTNRKGGFQSTGIK